MISGSRHLIKVILPSMKSFSYLKILLKRVSDDQPVVNIPSTPHEALSRPLELKYKAMYNIE